MNYEDVQKVSNAAKAKSNLVNTNFFKYFIRAVMAGFFIGVAMIRLLYTSPRPRDRR